MFEYYGYVCVSRNKTIEHDVKHNLFDIFAGILPRDDPNLHVSLVVHPQEKHRAARIAMALSTISGLDAHHFGGY
jgi:hypothetical protein